MGRALTDAGDLLRDCVRDGLAGGRRERRGAHARERERHVDPRICVWRAVGRRCCCRGRLRLRLAPCGAERRRGRHTLQHMMPFQAPLCCVKICT